MCVREFVTKNAITRNVHDSNDFYAHRHRHSELRGGWKQ